MGLRHSPGGLHLFFPNVEGKTGMSEVLDAETIEKIVLNAKRVVQGHPCLTSLRDLRAVQRTRAIVGRPEAERFANAVQESLRQLLEQKSILCPYYTVMVVPGGRKDRIAGGIGLPLPSVSSPANQEELRTFALQSVQRALLEQSTVRDDLNSGWKNYFAHHHIAIGHTCSVSLAVGACVSAPGMLFAVRTSFFNILLCW